MASRVLDQLPLREKILRQALSARDCGSLEILVRGVDVDPDALRRRLRPSGSQAMSLVIMRRGTGPAARAVAFVCRASAVGCRYAIPAPARDVVPLLVGGHAG